MKMGRSVSCYAAYSPSYLSDDSMQLTTPAALSHTKQVTAVTAAWFGSPLTLQRHAGHHATGAFMTPCPRRAGLLESRSSGPPIRPRHLRACCTWLPRASTASSTACSSGSPCLPRSAAQALSALLFDAAYGQRPYAYVHVFCRTCHMQQCGISSDLTPDSQLQSSSPRPAPQPCRKVFLTVHVMRCDVIPARAWLGTAGRCC